MYAIYGDIYHQYTPNVSIYTSTMDPMGYSKKNCKKWPDWSRERHRVDQQVIPLVTGIAIALGLDYDIFLAPRQKQWHVADNVHPWYFSDIYIYIDEYL